MTKVTAGLEFDIKKGSQSNYIFEATISADAKKSFHTKTLQKFQKNLKKPGFRTWHVPLDMVEKSVNPMDLWMTVLEDIVNSILKQAVDKYPDYKRLGQIHDLNTEKFGKEDEDGTISFELDVFPEVEVKDDKWKSVKVSEYTIELTDEEIQKTIDQLRSSYANFEDRELVDETSLMRLKTQHLDDKGNEVWRSKNHYIGKEELEVEPQLHQEFIGKKKWDIVTLDYDKVKRIHLLKSKEDTAKTIQCEIIDIKQKVLPELNQEFIDRVFQKEDNINSVDDLKAKVTETLKENKSENMLFEWVGEYLKKIDNSFALEIPKTLIEEESKHRVSQIAKQLGGEEWLKRYLDNMGEEESKRYLKNVEEGATKSIYNYFILKHVANELELDINREEPQKDAEVEKKLYEKLTQAKS